MYCGSCLHGNTLATALRRLGVDCVIAPIYTPVRTDDDTIGVDRLALGGINVYLQQRWAFFRSLPAFMLRALDQPWLVRWASSRASSTRPEELGDIAMATFNGEDGPLKNEFNRLVDWLETEMRPDVVHLSNVMLAGLARPLVKRLGVPVVCTLSGEDTFLEKLPTSHRERAKTLLRERVADLAALIALNERYADFMADYLNVPRDKIHVIRPGLHLQGHRQPSDAISPRNGPRAIGYFGRILHDKGIHLLVDALGRLKADADLPPFKLRVAGYLDAADRPYLAQLQRDAVTHGLADRFEYLGELDRPQKISFLQSLDIVSLPSLYRESKGLPALEAWANGVPTVLPDHGAFAELLADTGGGLSHIPGDAGDLAAALARMLRDPQTARAQGLQAQRIVHDHYNIMRTAQDTLELYKSLCSPAAIAR